MSALVLTISVSTFFSADAIASGVNGGFTGVTGATGGDAPCTIDVTTGFSDSSDVVVMIHSFISWRSK